MKRICVFAGSRPGARPEYVAAAAELGSALADRGVGLVFGGGKVGLMGVLADAVLAGAGHAVGVIPEAMVDRELAHPELTELRVVCGMHERKAMMVDLADGFVVLPGGTGTLDELFEAFTWAQLGIHRKPLGILNVGGYYDGLIGFLENVVTEGFLTPDDRAMLHVESRPAALLDRLDGSGGA